MKNILRKFKYTLFNLILISIFKIGKIEVINKLLYLYRDSRAVFILKTFGATIGTNVGVLPPLIVHTHKLESDYRYIKIGNNCRIGRNTLFDLGGEIIIEDNVVISMGVTLLTHIDTGTSPLSSQPRFVRYSRLHIKKGAYIGANATILDGVTIGENSVIGAGSVVTRDVQSNTIVAGVPAMICGNITNIS